MSGGRNGIAGRRSADAVIGRFLGDRYVVHVALAHTRIRDAHELRPRPHLFDVVAAGVTHRCAQTSCELVEDRDDAALVRHAPLNAFGHQLLELRSCVLEVAVARALALSHRTERSHTPVGLVRRALVELDLPGDSSVPANSPPIITQWAPAAIAFATSPEKRIPPSAISGTPSR